MPESVDKILQDRQAIYGDAQPNLVAIGRMWGALLEIPDIPPHLVALMFDASKSVRAMRNPIYEDSWLDKIGYIRHGMETLHRGTK